MSTLRAKNENQLPQTVTYMPVLCDYSESAVSKYGFGSGRSPGVENNKPEHVKGFDEYAESDQPCPYCLEVLTRSEMKDEAVRDRCGGVWYQSLWRCESCGWWAGRTLSLFEEKFFDEIHNQDNYYYGLARRYNVSDINPPLEQLRSFLAKHPEHVVHTNSRVFELLMRDCIQDLYAPCEVIHIGKTGDGGVDLKLITTDSGTFLVQVKRRLNLSKPEGVKTVRELNGVLFRDRAAKGIIITTAKTFTAGCEDEIRRTLESNESYEMRLLAFKDIVAMLGLTPPKQYEPWKKYLRDDLSKYGSFG